MVAGRPREYNRDQIALDLLSWSKKSDSINMCAFCGDRDMSPTKITDWARECDKFRAAYEAAKSNIGARREQWLKDGQLHVKAYDLNAPTYDRFMKEERQDEKRFENKLKMDLFEFMHKLKEKEVENLSEDLQKQFDSLMIQITKSQDRS